MSLLLVTAIIGVVLVFGYASIWHHEIQRLDVRLCIEARRLATEPVHIRDHDRLADDLISKLHLDDAAQLSIGVGRTDRLTFAYGEAAWLEAEAQKSYAWRTVDPGSPSLRGCESAQTHHGPSHRDWRAARVSSREALAVVGIDLTSITNDLQGRVKDALATILPLSLALAVLVAWTLSAAANGPVARLRKAMTLTRNASLSYRVRTTGEDVEFRELVDAYNAMLERLQVNFEQASRFSADAAHELVTPLTILRGRIEGALRRPSRDDAFDVLDELQEEVDRLITIVRKLLLLSRADAGELAIRKESVNFSALVEALVHDAALASDVELHAQIAPDLVLQADPTLLMQLLNNLMTNALRYSANPGWIRVTTLLQANAVTLRIANACAPIPTEQRQRLFDRFYRGDPSRTRRSGGSGLGLSIAREIAVAHSGTLTLEDGPEDVVSLTLTLPAV